MTLDCVLHPGTIDIISLPTLSVVQPSHSRFMGLFLQLPDTVVGLSECRSRAPMVHIQAQSCVAVRPPPLTAGGCMRLPPRVFNTHATRCLPCISVSLAQLLASTESSLNLSSLISVSRHCSDNCTFDVDLVEHKRHDEDPGPSLPELILDLPLFCPGCIMGFRCAGC